MIARVVAENDTTVTVEWDPVPGVGYRFLRDGAHLSHTWDATRTRTTFRKTGPNHVFEVQALVPDVARVPWPTALTVPQPAWTVREETQQTDPGSGAGNRYTFGWIKSRRDTPIGPPHWDVESVIEFSDYPDEFVMIESKRFDVGYPGRTTNFHLVGDEIVGERDHSGVSPVSADYRPGRSPDWPTDGTVVPGLVVTNQAELDDHRRGHWQLATDAEIQADRAAVWTLVWRIRWRDDRTGHIHVTVIRNGLTLRTLQVSNVKTAYTGQRPRLYLWLGGYESAGLSSPAQITQTLDRRGRTLTEAFADRPVLGSTITSVRAGGNGPSSTVTGGSILNTPAAP